MNKFNEEFLKILTEAYFEENDTLATWGKDALFSAVLIGDIFNSYIDTAEKTNNFTDFTQSDSLDQAFKASLIKNLLFIQAILDKANLDETSLYEALKQEKSSNYSVNHPSYTEFRERLSINA